MGIRPRREALPKQFKAIGWQWPEGDTDVPELIERESFRKVLLKDRLAMPLRKLQDAFSSIGARFLVS